MAASVRVFSSLHPARAELVKSGLMSAGIDVHIVGQDKAALVGGVPWTEADVALYVAAEDAESAQAIIQAMEHDMAQRKNEPDWVCPTCGEKIEAVFTECWNCTEA